ncbi:MAG: ABC transporter ATP-binding protein [Desulfobacteraceae bacterium 4572_88]|nr:MAG: ABC transporter ATP-binding protein [Desulfobacteraceae bacterium 4572_88]
MTDQEEWQKHRQVEYITSLMKLDPDAEFEVLSAGLKRRVLLARALVCKPDILLLDEPTNHMDIPAVLRTEDFLLSYGGTLLFVTHDRAFLRKLATRIVELDRGHLTNWPCDYQTYLERKQEMLNTEENQWGEFDKKLAQEEVWIRKGVKARRTRNEGRVRALMKMREMRQARRERSGTAQIQAQEAERTGKLVIEVRRIRYAYADHPVIQNFSTLIIRGDKVGIIGPNGCGKTTLLQILLKNLAPSEGNVRHGTHLEVAYFDQLRAQLDEEKSVQDNVADGNDKVIINGSPRHIIGYLKDFLFSPDRARSPVRALSGGERNRLLLAKLFTRPSNVLVLDEPTNDLDTETLELLEELLMNYQGTLLLVSHDRAFLNNVVTNTLAFEGNGRVSGYVGGYDDWLRQRKSELPAKEDKVPKARKQKPKTQGERPGKLSYKEQRELESLPQRIEAMEAEQEELYQIMADPEFYQQEGEKISRAKTRVADLERELEAAYEQWEALDARNPS